MRAFRQRTLLALLGLVAGIAAIVALLNLGHVAQLETLKIFGSQGTNLLTIQLNAAALFGQPPSGLDPASFAALPERQPAIRRVVSMVAGNIRLNASMNSEVALVAASPALNDLVGLNISRGRPLLPIDDDNLVAVVGAQAFDKLPRGRGIGPPNQVRIGGYIFHIVGVLAPSTPTALHLADYNNAILIPMGSARRVLGRTPVTAALVELHPRADQTEIAHWIESNLSWGLTSADVHVEQAHELIAAMRAQKSVNSALFLAIGAISIIAGGIGIMNVMLMSIAERHREIGLRKAVGARPAQLQAMFLIEAATLTGVGGIAGAIVGALVTLVVCMANDWVLALPIYPIPLALVLAVVVGWAFGWYPATLVTRLDPVEALRAD